MFTSRLFSPKGGDTGTSSSCHIHPCIQALSEILALGNIFLQTQACSHVYVYTHVCSWIQMEVK